MQRDIALHGYCGTLNRVLQTAVAVLISLLISVPFAASAQTSCGTGHCPAGTYCSQITPGKCIPNGRVDCGVNSCSPGDRCVNGNQCVHAPELLGAIAFGLQSDHFGVSWNYPTQEAANAHAIADCGMSDCQVVIAIPAHRCGALASIDGENGNAWGGAIRESSDSAALASVENCQKRSQFACRVRAVRCNQ